MALAPLPAAALGGAASFSSAHPPTSCCLLSASLISTLCSPLLPSLPQPAPACHKPTSVPRIRAPDWLHHNLVAPVFPSYQSKEQENPCSASLEAGRVQPDDSSPSHQVKCPSTFNPSDKSDCDRRDILRSHFHFLDRELSRLAIYFLCQNNHARGKDKKKDGQTDRNRWRRPG